MEILCKKRVFEGSRVSIDFDIVRYVLIFLMIFGHNLGTNLKSQAEFADAFPS
jgi:fucose 4-O-acetylase-like acetyltransferase